MDIENDEIEKIMREKNVDRETAFDIHQDRTTLKKVKEGLKQVQTIKEIEKKQDDIPQQQKKITLSIEKINKEPILNDNKPKWLIVKRKKTTESTQKEILEGTAITNEEIIFETMDQNQYQCNKCKAVTVFDDKPVFCPSCQRDATFKQITDKINIKRWKLPKWKDINIQEIGMTVIYTDLVYILKKCIVLPDTISYDILALWIIASYKRESFDAISFLMFQGLIESGKTRGLDLIRELGYQMIHTTGVTFPCMCRYTDKFQAGILIDEIDNKVDKRTESGREYLDFLKPSYRKGSVYATAHREDQDDTKEYSNYGFKVFAGERGGDDPALRSRCITFKMEQGYPEIKELKYIKNELDEMQNLLLNYRYKTGNPEQLPMEFPLKGRDRELFSCIIETAQHIGLNCDNILGFINKRTEEKIETMQETDEYFVLKAIYSISTRETLDDAPEEIKYSEITSECGWDDGSDLSTKKKQSLGYVFKKLQLKTKRRKDGTVLLLNEPTNIPRLQNLYRRFYIT